MDFPLERLGLESAVTQALLAVPITNVSVCMVSASSLVLFLSLFRLPAPAIVYGLGAANFG